MWSSFSRTLIRTCSRGVVLVVLVVVLVVLEVVLVVLGVVFTEASEVRVRVAWMPLIQGAPLKLFWGLKSVRFQRIWENWTR